MSFESRAKLDSKYSRLIKIQNSIQSRIDDRALVKEMQNMLLARKYRTIDKSILENAARDLADWTGELNSYRSRLADIRFILLDSKLRLEDFVKVVQKHLLITFIDKLKGKNVGEKKASVDSVLEEPLRMVNKLDRLLKLSDEVQKELESSYYSSVLIKNIVEIATRPDRV